MRRHERLARTLASPPRGHRVRRPVVRGGTVMFDLTYLRTGGTGAELPVLIVPGGPGLASVVPYRALRRQAARRDLDVIMVEHRGVGLSRQDDSGADLPPEAVTVEQVVDDLAAVLDDAGVERAVVYGCSYGTYLAQGLGVRHPARVAGMVLDSPVAVAARHDVETRANLRRLFRDAPEPQTARGAALLRAVLDDELVPADSTGHVVQVVYEFGGAELLERLLGAVIAGRGRRTWDQVTRLGNQEIDGGTRFVMEPDLVGGITYSELGFGLGSDGLALDPHPAFAAAAARYPSFAGEPFDLPAAHPGFDWPTAVLSGARDLRTPRSVAQEIVGSVPGAVLVTFDDLGHSVLDTHALAALHVAHIVAGGGLRRLPDLAPRIAALPRRGPSRLVGRLIGARLLVERVFGR